jgi:hypothetical protein
MADRLSGRNGDIWRDYIRGATQEALAEKYKLSRTRISQIITQVRDAIPERTRTELIQREVEFLDRLSAEVMELWDMRPVPVTAGKYGDVVRDPETGSPVWDHGGRLRALETALGVRKRMADLLGLNAPAKVQSDGTVRYVIEGVDLSKLD